MKIKSIECVRVKFPKKNFTSKPRKQSWAETDEVANPMSCFPSVKVHRSLWLPKWNSVWCKVTLENGVWGLGMTDHGAVAATIIRDHLAPNLVSKDGFAIEMISDMMFRLTKPFGTVGLASYAISAIDLALWDAKAKSLGVPVYSLIGGPKEEKIFCYATGNDVEWYKELGFMAYKLACPYGPADGLEGLKKNVDFVEKARSIIGDDAELMLDCWMALDVEYTVRLAEQLRHCRLRWMEECLLSEDFLGHVSLRKELPWQTLTTGEHWYTHFPFQWAVSNDVVDILQPDINWVGGLTTCLKIAAIAESAGKKVMLHAGGRNPYGQHFSHAVSCVPWLEYFVRGAPGIPLEETIEVPEQKIPKDGWMELDDRPGFGLGIQESWLSPY